MPLPTAQAERLATSFQAFMGVPLDTSTSLAIAQSMAAAGMEASPARTALRSRFPSTASDLPSVDFPSEVRSYCSSQLSADQGDVYSPVPSPAYAPASADGAPLHTPRRLGPPVFRLPPPSFSPVVRATTG